MVYELTDTQQYKFDASSIIFVHFFRKDSSSILTLSTLTQDTSTLGEARAHSRKAYLKYHAKYRYAKRSRYGYDMLKYIWSQILPFCHFTEQDELFIFGPDSRGYIICIIDVYLGFIDSVVILGYTDLKHHDYEVSLIFILFLTFGELHMSDSYGHCLNKFRLCNEVLF